VWRDCLFQEYIRGEIKQRINHSSAGGRVLKDYIILNPKFVPLKKKINFRYFQEVICYVIFAHHGLYDQIEYGEAEHKEHLRMEYDQEGGYHYQEDVLTFVRSFDTTLQEKGELSFEELIEAAFEEFKVLYKELRELSNKNSDDERKKEEKEYYIACLTRLCLSILKEADIYDSANVFREPKQVLWQMDERYEVWLESFKRIEHMYQEYESIPNPSEINAARNILAKRVKEAALANDTGIFKLELPTGAGKTKGGLRYALTNAQKLEILLAMIKQCWSITAI
jgi:CRISPR-associated endonuclease/helicase Cas3